MNDDSESVAQDPKPELSDKNALQDAKLKTEYLVVLAFTVLPLIYLSMIGLMEASAKGTYSVGALASVLGQDAAICIPLLYILRMNGGTWKEVGIVRPRPKDCGWALIAFIGGWFAARTALSLVASLHPERSAQDTERIAEMMAVYQTPIARVVVIVASLSTGFTEELLFRGYLLTRWQRLGGSAGQAVAATSIMFGIVHLYQGLSGVISSAVMGMMFGIIFVVTKRLWPLAIAHALWDILAFLAY